MGKGNVLISDIYSFLLPFFFFFTSLDPFCFVLCKPIFLLQCAMYDVPIHVRTLAG